MKETYTLVGTDPSWIVAFMPVPAVIILLAARWKRKERPVFTWGLLAPVVWFFVCSMLGIPMEWILAGACMGGGLGLAVLPHLKVTLRQRIVFAVVYIGLGVSFVVLGTARHEKIVLTDSQVTVAESGGAESVPRQGLRIIVIQKKPWFNIRGWGSWTSFSSAPRPHLLGPNFTGFDVYWGPSGLIRGDDLALRFAHWAEVVPKVQSGDRYPYRETPLPGFTLSRAKS